MNKMILLFSVLVPVYGLADEIKIQASMGDRVVSYHASQMKGEYVLTLQVSDARKKQVKLGKENFSTLKNKLNALLEMKAEKEECSRDASSAEYKPDSGKAKSIEVCYLSNTPRGRAFRALVNLMSAAVN